jgi:hypothetical protein
MKDIGVWIGKAITLLFATLIIFYTASLTFMVAGRLLPGNLLMQVMTVVLFDVAAIIWFLTYITQARSTSQWAISLIGFGIGLLGTVTMAAGELILGQQLVVFNDPSRLGWILITCVIVACLAHVTLVYLYHFTDPVTKNRVDMQQQVAAKIAQANKEAIQMLEAETTSLARAYRDTVIEHAKQIMEGEIGVNIKERNKKALDNAKINGTPPVISGIARDPGPGDHRGAQPYVPSSPMNLPLAASPGNGRPRPNDNHNGHKPTPPEARMHNVTSAAQGQIKVEEAATRNGNFQSPPPPSGSRERS